MPQKRLTDRALKGLKADPSGKQIDWWDTRPSARGFGVRVSGKPGAVIKSFNLLYRFRGVQKRLKIGRYPEMPLRDAYTLALQALGDVAKGNDPAVTRDADRAAGTFATLADEYIERHAKPTKRSWKEDQRMLNKDVIPLWGTRKAKDISRADVRDLLDGLVGRGESTVRHIQALVSTVFNFAVSRGWMDASPCARIQRVGGSRVRERVLSHDELRKIDAAATADKNQDLATMLRLELLTAQRGGEIRRMRFSDLQIPAGALDSNSDETIWWTVPAEHAKNKKANRVPLSATAVKLLRSYIEARRSDCVFPSPRFTNRPYSPMALQKYKDRLREASGIADFNPHDLRRTAATKLGETGRFTEFLIDRLQNHIHGRKKVTATYQKYDYADEKVDMVIALERIYNGILAGHDASAKVLAFPKTA
ncbi:MAG: hypothetical protein DMF84_09685 [Acidobacteria bacterium]|nr:MAG: hypothetical protein DMF84_09685 [Acidobacteriota bacterium]